MSSPYNPLKEKRNNNRKTNGHTRVALFNKKLNIQPICYLNNTCTTD